MKKRMLNGFGIMLVMAAIVFSFIQLNIPVVKADVCPSNPFSDCANCYLGSVVSSECSNWPGCVHYTCYYWCTGCAGPGGDPMAIERTVEVYE